MWTAELPAYLLALTSARLVFWPALGAAGATLAMAVREGRRRTALNECLHELRRPLQALVLLAHGEGPRRGPDDDSSVEMAAAALARLEREINGVGPASTRPRETFAVRPLLEAAARRWRPQMTMRGKGFALRWDCEEAAVEGDRIELAAALDNLLANALEHGGGRIELAADLGGRGVCVAVVDSGGGDRKGRRDPRSPFGGLSGRARRGHGLRLVRRAAARHGGTFALHEGEHGTSAVLELPTTASRWSEPRSSAGVAPDERSDESPLTRPNLDLPVRPEIVIRRSGR